MELFDKKFVYLEWDDVLKGKKVLAGDNLQFMRRDVNDGTAKLRCIEDNSYNKSNSGNLYPFKDDSGTTWALVYYDQLYDVKLAWKHGKQIQARSKGSTRNEWMNIEHPGWLDTYEYRVKPDKFKLTQHSDTNKLELVSVDVWTEDEETKCIGTREECVHYMAEHYCKKCSKQKIVHVYDNCTGFIAKKWRPFKDIQELKQAWEKKFDPLVHPELFEPMIWVRSKFNTTSTFLITHFCGNVDVVHINSSLNTSLEQLFDDYTFLDGTPCGVEE